MQKGLQVMDAAKRERYPEMTDDAFSKLIGIAPTTYSDYKNRGSVPSLPVALTVALALNLDLRALVVNATEVAGFFEQAR